MSCMKPLTTTLLVAGGVLLLLSISKVGLAVKSLTAKIIDLDLSCGGILCTSPEINLKLQIRNPSGEAFDIRSLSGDFFFNGSRLGDASSLTQLTIPGYSEVIYPVLVSVNAANVVDTVKSLFNGGLKGELGLQGTLNVAGVPVPVNTTYRLI